MNLETTLAKMLVTKEKRQILIKHVHLKFGVALAISVGGIIFTFFRTKPPESKSVQLSPGSNSNLANSKEENGDHIDDHLALQDSSLPEMSSQVSIIFEDDENKREITKLMSKIKFLEERETNLEIQMLEYYGLKEQETLVVELQNRLRLCNAEAKLQERKIESLQSDNERLEAQVADYAKVVNELEAAKAKIKLLKRKLRFEAKENRDHILTIQEKVVKMKNVDEDVEMKPQTQNELEKESEEMKKSNKGLETVSSGLAQKLEHVQMLAPTVLDSKEVHELKEESKRLKVQNEDLTKEVAQIQGDRCKEIKELVHLRLMNASLLCELKNYGTGDLSQKLSPNSEKPDNLILDQYSNTESDLMEKGNSIVDFDSQDSSCLSEVGEMNDDPSVDTNKKLKRSSSKSTKEIFSKLKRLLSGKGSFSASKPPLQRAVSVDEIDGKYSRDSYNRRLSFDSRGQNSRSSSTRESSSSSRRASDDGSPMSVVGRIESSTGDDRNDWSSVTQNDVKIELELCPEDLKILG